MPDSEHKHMKHIAKPSRALVLLIALVLCTATAFAQDAVVERNVYLRPTPSTSNQPIRKLIPPDEVELLGTNQVDGYYHVRTVDGDEEGWVWGRNIRIGLVSEADVEAEVGVAKLAASTVTSNISPAWVKPTPVTDTFKSGTKTCGPTGSAPGNETNRLKNRVDVPSSYYKVQFEGFFKLPDLHVPKDRSNWKQDDAVKIAKFEGVPISMTGYLVAIKPQVGGSGETTNCKWTQYSETDWHMALVEEPGQGEKLAIVVETTPRIRNKHKKWTEANLKPWLDSDLPVRISGWLMFDPEHRNHMGRYRKSMWEIHPITKIEVWKNGKWIDLDKF
jgi:hypothetical protein